jgi:site-specific DNA-methyltransferase (adenine-specific)
MEYLIKTYTNEGQVVLDFTMGSGTTGVACANTGRKFIGIEKDPKYFELASARIEKAYAETLESK